jgi:hypothetical protein
MTDEPARRRNYAEEWANKEAKPSERKRIYDGWYTPVEMEAELTSETIEQADKIFDEIVVKSRYFKNSKVEEKREFFRRLYHAGKKANYHNGCIMYPRNKSHPEYSSINIQIIEACLEAGLFTEERSPKGSPKMSRLVPTEELIPMEETDPWEFEPQDTHRFVFLRNREDKSDIPFDINEEFPASIQERLLAINSVNSKWKITHESWNAWERRYTGTKQLRPIHFAVFTDDWTQHGRLYTGKYGHQSLIDLERKTIKFNGKPSIELDYSGMHPRLLYHLNGMEYKKDPYRLWGDKTTDEMRYVAKIMVNAAINAPTANAAIAACNYGLTTYTKERDTNGKLIRKSGKTLDSANLLEKALRVSKLTFKEVYDKVLTYHKPIAHLFSNDYGIKLMRIDSAIALDIMYFHADQCIPCLGVHDSFIVPENKSTDLYQLMHQCYKTRTGFYPKLKNTG